MNPETIEKYSSAMTLSDMEIFVFPELMFAILLADIMSPIIWQWRQLDCFKKLEGKSSYKKLLRLRQFIMDEFDFNLDLETWGLTTKARELARFEKFISPTKSPKAMPCSAMKATNTISMWISASTLGWINTIVTSFLIGRRKQ